MQGAIRLYFHMLNVEHKKCPTLCGRAYSFYRYIFLNTTKL
nr:MAG TPA: Rad50 zinc hook motif [Caudoviricetes sp.]